MKNKQNIILIVLSIIVFYVAGVSSYQRYKDPKLTETELFLLLPCNVVLKFK